MDKNFIDRLNKYSQNWQRISCWVYVDKNNIPQVYSKQKPNTKQIWIQFYNMNHYFWNIIERQCIDEIKGHNDRDIILNYNQCKLKKFFLKYLIKDWSLPFEINRQIDGALTQQTLQHVYRLHPFILRQIVNSYEYYQRLTQQQQKNLQKQCYLLFDKDGSVSNPHWAISLYIDLSAFWDKFGLNYYDIQQLPIQVFDGLKKVMQAQNSITSSKLKSSSNTNSVNSKQIRF